ncbi:hypothetical protein SK128_007398 [Halocaridina rubra]|uniref:Uncharacterized protein n=1 Tax=Halocaridina rubra TaxID=373956 RepID=A0AAN8WZ98_HALRR
MHATYLPKLLTEKAGARVAIHRPGTRPVLDDHGIDIPPGMVSSIAIKRRVTNFLAAPYSANCTVFWNTTNYAPVGNSSGNKEYTITDIARTKKRILCYRSRQRVCESCNENLRCKPSLSGLRLQCCLLRHRLYKSDIDGIVASEAFSAPGDPDDTVRENLLRLDVYFNTLTSENITQVEVYKSFWDLVSELGGALSLYIGISIFLLVEVIELFFYLIFNSYLYCVGRYELTEETSECHCHCQEAKVHPLNATKQPFSSDTSGPTPAYNTLFKSDNIQQRKFTANSMDVAFDKAFNP